MVKTVLLTLVVTLLVLLVAILAMAFRPLLFKNGKFHSFHIGDSKEMKKRGIHCATSQDREARKDINNNKYN